MMEPLAARVHCVLSRSGGQCRSGNLQEHKTSSKLVEGYYYLLNRHDEAGVAYYERQRRHRDNENI